jgi:tellurite resistance protein TehA-like permease
MQTTAAWLAALPASSFAVAMATTTLGINLDRSGQARLGDLVVLVAVAVHVGLVALSAARAARHSLLVAHELRSPVLVPGYLTAVIATNVVGVGLTRVLGWADGGRVLAWIAAAIWPFATAMVLRRRPGPTPPTLLLAVVALTTAIALSVHAGAMPQPFFSLVATFAAALGTVLYLVIVTVVLLELRRARPAPALLSPAHWIDYGAAALCTVALVRLRASATVAGAPSFLTDLQATLRVAAIVMWLLSVALLPGVLVLGWWRHVRHRVAYRYNVGYWSMAFPAAIGVLGTREVAELVDSAVLGWVADAGTGVVGAMWLILVAGTVQACHRAVVAGAPAPPPSGS